MGVILRLVILMVEGTSTLRMRDALCLTVSGFSGESLDFLLCNILGFSYFKANFKQSYGFCLGSVVLLSKLEGGVLDPLEVAFFD